MKEEDQKEKAVIDDNNGDDHGLDSEYENEMTEDEGLQTTDT